jgi:hypothetical protein
MMSLEIDKAVDGEIDCAKLYVDDEGIEDLERILKFLKTRKTDHVDLFSKNWGGIGEISGESREPENQPIQYLKIMFVAALSNNQPQPPES